MGKGVSKKRTSESQLTRGKWLTEPWSADTKLKPHLPSKSCKAGHTRGGRGSLILCRCRNWYSYLGETTWHYFGKRSHSAEDFTLKSLTKEPHTKMLMASLSIVAKDGNQPNGHGEEKANV